MTHRVLVIGTGFGAAVHMPALAGIAGLPAPILVSGRSNAWQEAIAAKACDVAIVAVPPIAQGRIAKVILSAGMPVLLEKPGALSAAELAQLHGNSASLAIGYSFRFARGLMQMIELAVKGMIGDIRHVAVSWITSGWASPDRPWSWRCDRTSGGGVLRDFACHSLDYLRLLLPQRFDRVTAQTRIITPKRCATDGSLHSVTAPEQVELLLASSNATASLSIASCMPCGQGHSVAVHGSRGRLVWTHDAPFALNTERLVLTRIGGVSQEIALAPDEQTEPDARISAARRQFAAFLKHGDTAAAPQVLTPASLGDARAILDLIAAAERSADERRTIPLPA